MVQARTYEQYTEHHNNAQSADNKHDTRRQEKAFDRTARSCLRACNGRDKEARQENSERPINHSMSENEVKMETKRMVERHGLGRDAYIIIANPPPFPSLAPMGMLAMVGFSAAMLSISLWFHIAPPVLIRAGIPPEVKMPGTS